MRKQFAVFTLLIVLVPSVQAFVYDEWQSITQPNGTTFTAHVFGDEISGNQFTADGYAFVYNASDEYYYYAELDLYGRLATNRRQYPSTPAFIQNLAEADQHRPDPAILHVGVLCEC